MKPVPCKAELHRQESFRLGLRSSRPGQGVAESLPCPAPAAGFGFPPKPLGCGAGGMAPWLGPAEAEAPGHPRTLVPEQVLWLHGGGCYNRMLHSPMRFTICLKFDPIWSGKALLLSRNNAQINRGSDPSAGSSSAEAAARARISWTTSCGRSGGGK